MHLQRISIVPALTASRIKSDGTSAVRLQVNVKGNTAYIPTNVHVKPTQWNKAKRIVVGHLYADSINQHIRNLVALYEDAARLLIQQGGARGMTALQVRNKLLEMTTPQEQKDVTLVDVLTDIADNARAKATSEIYNNTVKRVLMYDPNITFSGVTCEWLKEFDAWLCVNGSPSKNARNIHLRNIRRAFNKALADNLTTARYPFREFAVRPEPVPPQALTSEELHALLAAEDVTNSERYWLDMLALSFCLIGINMADIVQLTTIKRGRINYKRAKTGKMYTIKVTPQALDIIKQHRGETHLINIAEIYKSTHIATTACLRHINSVCDKIGLPHCSWYTARYSWASIAANECEIPIDTISLALGHSYGLAVTLGYIANDYTKVDRANEQVIAKVLGK